MYRYRQHLVPLTDMDGSDDSEGSMDSVEQPTFLVSSYYIIYQGKLDVIGEQGSRVL